MMIVSKVNFPDCMLLFSFHHMGSMKSLDIAAELQIDTVNKRGMITDKADFLKHRPMYHFPSTV